MTIDLALEYIPRRMKELGYEDYAIRFRHMVLQPKQRIKLNGENELFVLIEPVEDISVRSETGIFDLAEFNVNEYQYEHQGTIKIRNYGMRVAHLRFIQVIPKL
jgi:hypothetical protein